MKNFVNANESVIEDSTNNNGKADRSLVFKPLDLFKNIHSVNTTFTLIQDKFNSTNPWGETISITSSQRLLVILRAIYLDNPSRFLNINPINVLQFLVQLVKLLPSNVTEGILYNSNLYSLVRFYNTTFYRNHSLNGSLDPLFPSLSWLLMGLLPGDGYSNVHTIDGDIDISTHDWGDSLYREPAKEKVTSIISSFGDLLVGISSILENIRKISPTLTAFINDLMKSLGLSPRYFKDDFIYGKSIIDISNAYADALKSFKGITSESHFDMSDDKDYPRISPTNNENDIISRAESLLKDGVDNDNK